MVFFDIVWFFCMFVKEMMCEKIIFYKLKIIGI